MSFGLTRGLKTLQRLILKGTLRALPKPISKMSLRALRRLSSRETPQIPKWMLKLKSSATSNLARISFKVMGRIFITASSLLGDANNTRSKSFSPSPGKI